MPTKLVLGTPAKPVRMSYAHVFQPTKLKSEDDSKLKYQCTFLIDKTDTKLVEEIRAAYAAEQEIGKSSKWNGTIPKKMDDPLRDGDLEDKEEYAGHWFMVAKDKSKPGIIDRNGKPIINPDDFYSGCYGIASVSLYAFNIDNTSKGVAVALNHLMKTAEGEPFSGRESATDAFADFIKPGNFNALD